MAYVTPGIVCIIMVSWLMACCTTSPIKRPANQQIENMCYGKKCVVDVDFPIGPGGTNFPENLTNTVVAALPSIVDAQNKMVGLLMNQTENQLVTQTKMMHLLRNQDALQKPVLLPIMTANDTIKVIKVDNETSSALSAIPKIADSQEKILSLLHNQTTIMTALFENVEKCLQYQPDMKSASLPIPLPPRDCKDILEQRFSISKAYLIKPWRDLGSFTVYCDMETDGGGWTVFQRRFNGSVDFYRGWEDYVQGFGDPEGEHWAGLELVYQLTRAGSLYLRVDLENFGGNTAYEKYNKFRMESGTSSYQISYETSYGSYGSARNGLSEYTKTPFITMDNNHNKRSSYNCAQEKQGAWWCSSSFSSQKANLNGRYLGQYKSNETGMYWYPWRRYESLKKSSMKIRRL